MPTTTLTLGNEQLSSTMYVVMKEWRDNLFKQVALLDAMTRVHGEGQPTQVGGTRIVQPLGFGEHSSPTQLRTGYERINLSVSDVFVPAVFDWAATIQPVAISGEEERVNQGEAAVISILEARTKQVASAMRRAWNKQIVAGGVTGYTDWSSLNGVDSAVAGFLENANPGSQTRSVGGVSKATYANIVGWQNQWYDGAGSFNANGLAGLYDLKVEAMAVSPDGAFDIWLASLDGFKNLKRSLQAYERYIDKAPDGGRMVEYWDGVQIAAEPEMADSGAQSAAAPISFMGINSKNIHITWDPDGYFEMSEFKTISGEFNVRSADILVRGQLITNHLGSSGLATNLDTF